MNIEDNNVATMNEYIKKCLGYTNSTIDIVDNKQFEYEGRIFSTISIKSKHIDKLYYNTNFNDKLKGKLDGYGFIGIKYSLLYLGYEYFHGSL